MSQLSVVQQLKPKTAIEKKTKTVVDTIMVTPELLNKWLSPPFQRPLRENDKVRALAEQLKSDGGVLPGICICMWLYRNITLKEYSKKTPQFSKDQFRKCLLSLSADSNYLDWLVGRKLGERDRSPAYSRIKAIFIKRIAMDNGGVRIPLPQPPWQHSGHMERFK